MRNLPSDKGTILVVDDEASIRRILQTRLEMIGYSVVTASDGEEALSAFRLLTPDLIVLDVMMPKLDGYGVCQELRKQSDVPIIMLTALADVADRITGLELTVIGCARSSDAIDKIRQKFSAPNDFTSVDVANEQLVEKWAEHILNKYEPPDIVINNAAITNYPAPLWEIPSEEFSVLIDINIKGVANIIRHFVPAMVKNKRGIIVNFSSGWGRSTSAQVAPYCASKWAIEGLTRSLAQELPTGMAAIPLNPGIIHTDMLSISFGEEAANYTPVSDWVLKAVPFILKLKPKDNGIPLTIS